MIEQLQRPLQQCSGYFFVYKPRKTMKKARPPT